MSNVFGRIVISQLVDAMFVFAFTCCDSSRYEARHPPAGIGWIVSGVPLLVGLVPRVRVVVDPFCID
jgi:hypothetical protein